MSVSLVKRPMPQGTMWVCQDCMFAAANGEIDDDRSADLPEVWALENDTDVTPGITREAHSCDDPDSWERGEDCGCERREFSSSRCDGCGTHLAGERHAFTYWA